MHAWDAYHSANNLLTLENASDLLKTLLPRCPVVWTTLKKIGINLPISPSNPLFHRSVRNYPIKKLFSAKRTREKKRYTLTEPCYYSLPRSRSFRNCRVALLLCQFVMELIVFFCLFWLVLFLILSSAFILFILILICMHARFFFEERLVIHPAIHSFIVHSLYNLPAFLSNLQTGHE